MPPRKRLTAAERAYRGVSEKQWQADVVGCLQRFGWTVYHAWSSVHSEAGFPDLFAIHGKTGDVLGAELKRETEQPSPDQLRWMLLFEMAEIDWYCWRPSNMDDVVERAGRHPQEATS